MRKILFFVSMLFLSCFAMGESGDMELEQAREFFYRKDFKNAEKYYLSAIDKGNLTALNDIGNLYYLKGDYSTAKKYYLKALENDSNAGVIVNLGLAYESLGEAKMAEETHLKAIEKGFVASMYNLASFYEEQGKNQEAKKWYKKALENGIESTRESLEKLELSESSKLTNKNNSQNLFFETITLKLVGHGLLKTDDNKIELEYENFKAIGKDKKTYSENDFKINGKKPKIIISKIVSTKMIRNLIETEEEIHVIGFLKETDDKKEVIKYSPFDFKFTENQDWVDRIYLKDGVIYIWDKDTENPE